MKLKRMQIEFTHWLSAMPPERWIFSYFQSLCWITQQRPSRCQIQAIILSLVQIKVIMPWSKSFRALHKQPEHTSRYNCIWAQIVQWTDWSLMTRDHAPHHRMIRISTMPPSYSIVAELLSLCKSSLILHFILTYSFLYIYNIVIIALHVFQISQIQCVQWA